MRPCLPVFEQKISLVPVITTEILRKSRKEKLRQLKTWPASGEQELALSCPCVPGDDADEIRGTAAKRPAFVNPDGEVSFTAFFVEARRGVGWFVHKQGGEERKYKRHSRDALIASAAPP